MRAAARVPCSSPSAKQCPLAGISSEQHGRVAAALQRCQLHTVDIGFHVIRAVSLGPLDAACPGEGVQRQQ